MTTEPTTTDVQGWAWEDAWGPQPADQHVRAMLWATEPVTNEERAQQQADFEAAMEAEDRWHYQREESALAFAYELSLLEA